MGKYIAQKLIATIQVMLLVSAGVFLLLHLIPGDPVAAMLGDNATPEAAASLRHELSLDLPLPQQYVNWLGHVVTGDLVDRCAAASLSPLHSATRSSQPPS